MSIVKDYTKTWIPGNQRGTQTFNAPGTLTIPYGRYKGTVSGRGGSGNAPLASAWSTNYNTNYSVANPIANQPLANQPAATWNTNYNTNYNVAYPIASQPYAGEVYYVNPSYYLGYFVVYWAKNFSPAYLPVTYYAGSPWSIENCAGPWNVSMQYDQVYAQWFCSLQQAGNSGQYPAYNTNYNVAYPVANRPIANQPIATWTTNYNTNYSVAYPIANQPIATQPVNAYTPGNAGQATNLLGVTFPGGPIDLSGFAGPPGTATPISNTVINYSAYPDNTSYPVTVPTGAQIVVKIE